MKIKMNVEIGGIIKKIKFNRQEDKSDKPRANQKEKKKKNIMKMI